MKCPYCGGESQGRVCPYCNSDLSSLMPPELLEESRKAEEAKGRDKDDDDEDEDEDDEITDEMIDEIKELCYKFQKSHSDEFSSYDEDGELAAGKGVKDKLFDLLEIEDDEEVFLIHDDTIFHSGKDGCAITDGGFCCKIGGEDVQYTDFEDIDEDDEVDFDETSIFLVEDGTPLLSYTGSEDVKKDLCTLCEDIIDVLYGD